MHIPVDVVIGTYRRPAALAVTLTSLCSQSCRDFRVIISDQSDDPGSFAAGEVIAVLRVLEEHGHFIETHRHLPRLGLAEQRQFLLDRVQARYALFLDDDLILEPETLALMLNAISAEGCGFVGQAVIGLSFINDVRPEEQEIEYWEGRVQPEIVVPDGPEWKRHRLHNAANLYHVQSRLGLKRGDYRAYKIAWIGGCVMYDTEKLRSVGGFGFWRELPASHCGEDVLAQLRMMAVYGGCGIIPSGVYHQELPTTVTERAVDAPYVLDILPGVRYRAGLLKAEIKSV